MPEESGLLRGLNALGFDQRVNARHRLDARASYSSNNFSNLSNLDFSDLSSDLSGSDFSSSNNSNTDTTFSLSNNQRRTARRLRHARQTVSGMSSSTDLRVPIDLAEQNRAILDELQRARNTQLIETLMPAARVQGDLLADLPRPEATVVAMEPGPVVEGQVIGTNTTTRSKISKLFSCITGASCRKRPDPIVVVQAQIPPDDSGPTILATAAPARPGTPELQRAANRVEAATYGLLRTGHPQTIQQREIDPVAIDID
jgi:hypothetical protein